MSTETAHTGRSYVRRHVCFQRFAYDTIARENDVTTQSLIGKLKSKYPT